MYIHVTLRNNNKQADLHLKNDHIKLIFWVFLHILKTISSLKISNWQ